MPSFSVNYFAISCGQVCNPVDTCFLLSSVCVEWPRRYAIVFFSLLICTSFADTIIISYAKKDELRVSAIEQKLKQKIPFSAVHKVVGKGSGMYFVINTLSSVELA